MLKRFLLVLLTLSLLLAVLPVSADEGQMALEDLTVEYVGGVVLRTIPRDDPTAELINVAYVQCAEPYVVVGETVEYEVVLSGGVAPYTIQVLLVSQELSDTSNSYRGYARYTLENGSNTFTQVFSKEARFFFQITVTDSQQQSVLFQTRPFTSYPPESETDATTVAGKVNQIIRQEITSDMSDYAIARTLHDWLIYHADYDYTYTNYGADGVLLKGTGVCDSYARAYQALLRAAGINCTIVTGYGNGGAHAWNLVKLGGSWYHVDCTWDDPGNGGYENWNYFCLTDEQIAVDHQWNRENTEPLEDEKGMIAPETDSDALARTDDVDYDFEFTTLDELEAGYEKYVRETRKGSLVAKYMGTDTDGMWNSFCEWSSAVSNDLTSAGEGYVSSLSVDGTRYFSMGIYWLEGSMPYLRIGPSIIRGTTGETIEVPISEQAEDLTEITWISSDPAVATVRDGVVTCLSAGTASIQVYHGTNLLDSVDIHVLSAHLANFPLTLLEDPMTLTWQKIPGVTEYRLMRVFEGTTTLLKTFDETSIVLTAELVPTNVEQELYIVAARVVNGKELMTYTSEQIRYGAPVLRYNAVTPAHLEQIGASAFMGNSSLTGVWITEKVTSIGTRAFANCTSLKAVKIPASVTSIATNAFSGCTALRYAEVEANSYAEAYFQEYYPDVTIVYP